jgi:hypothetical protein
MFILNIRDVHNGIVIVLMVQDLNKKHNATCISYCQCNVLQYLSSPIQGIDIVELSKAI